MGKIPRQIIPGRLHELTLSTFQSRYFFIPSKRLNELVIGALAHAQRATDLRICFTTFLSNHGHTLFVPDSSDQVAGFLCLAKSQIAQEVQRLCGWTGGIFEPDSDITVVTEEPEAQIERLRYLMSQGVKEGLVPHPCDWPGVHSAKALLTGRMQLDGVWVRRSELYERVRKEKRRSKAVRRRRLDRATYKSYEEKVPLKLVPIPAWEDLPISEVARLSRELCAQILDENQEQIAKVKKGFRERLCDTSLFCFRPGQRKRSVRPLVHAATLEEWQRHADAFKVWLARYRYASERLRRGILEAVHEFPEQAFLPTGIVFKLREGLPPPVPMS